MIKIEVRKDGKTYARAEGTEPPYTNAELLEMIEAGYTVYRNGKRVSKASLQRGPARKEPAEDG